MTATDTISKHDQVLAAVHALPEGTVIRWASFRAEAMEDTPLFLDCAPAHTITDPDAHWTPHLTVAPLRVRVPGENLDTNENPTSTDVIADGFTINNIEAALVQWLRNAGRHDLVVTYDRDLPDADSAAATKFIISGQTCERPGR